MKQLEVDVRKSYDKEFNSGLINAIDDVLVNLRNKLEKVIKEAQN